MIVQFSAKQARIIGVLLEKEVTTPDQYPLSLNGLISACNQKSNREPVMNLSDTDVQNTVDELVAKKQIAEQSGFGSRVVKYKHRFCNTEFGDLKLDQQQLAVICVLLLRGPQTPGEIRTRTNRLAEFNNVDEVEQVLEGLREHNGEQLVIKLAREPGKRESRYQHCFTECGISKLDDSLQAIESSPSSSGQDAERIAALEQQVAQMQQQIAQLQECVNELIGN